jgi:hypothetical protein
MDVQADVMAHLRDALRVFERNAHFSTPRPYLSRAIIDLIICR